MSSGRLLSFPIMHLQRDWTGRPMPALDDWPFVVTATKTTATQTTLELRLPNRLAADIRHVLEILGALVAQLEHHRTCAQRDRRAAITRKAWTLRTKQMQQIYNRARRRGIGHRAALKTLVACPLFADLGWTATEFGRIVLNPTFRSTRSR